MNTPSSVSRHEHATEASYTMPSFDSGSGSAAAEPIHPKDAHLSTQKPSESVPASPLGSPISGDTEGGVCSPHAADSQPGPKNSSREAQNHPGANSADEAEAAKNIQYTEIALQIEREKTRQTELKCELARLVMDIMKTADTTGMTPELLRRMFLAEEPVDYKHYLHYMKAQMQSAGGPAPAGVKPETPSPRSPAIPSSVTYGTLASISGVNSAMGSSTSHSRSSSGRSLHPPACSSIDEREERSEQESGTATRAPSKTPDRAADRPMPVYTQPVFPYYYTHAEPPGNPATSAPTPQQMHANVSSAHTASGTANGGATAAPAAGPAAAQGKSDDGLGSPYNNSKYPASFQSSPTFRPSNQASPGSSAAQSPQPQASGLPSHTQPHAPVQQHMTGHQHAQTSQAQMFQAGSMPAHAMHATMMQASGAAGHAPGAPQPVFYMNAQPPLSAPMVPSSYYMPNNMVSWKLMPVPTDKRREEEEPHVTKKAKTGKNSLNFMITTPKNPPARKYNK